RPSGREPGPGHRRAGSARRPAVAGTGRRAVAAGRPLVGPHVTAGPVRVLMQRDHPDAGTVGVTRHTQDPARADQARDGELGAVPLGPAGFTLEDLPVATAITEMVLRDLPQAFVIPALRRLDHVDLPGPPHPMLGGLRRLPLAAGGAARFPQSARRGLPGAPARRGGGRRG